MTARTFSAAPLLAALVASALLAAASASTVGGLTLMCKKDGQLVVKNYASPDYVSSTVGYSGSSNCKTTTLTASNSETSSTQHADLWPVFQTFTFGKLLSFQEKIVTCSPGFSAGTPYARLNKADGSYVKPMTCDTAADVHYFTYLLDTSS